MRRHRLSPEVSRQRRDEAIAFLRQWLPDEAKEIYRQMINENPRGWWQDPHFAGGIIVEHALRGNGIDERALDVGSLDDIWPDLLKAAVQNGGSSPES